MVPAGGRLRIVDLHGNQAVDTLFYDAHDHTNRYSAMDTVREQGSVYLTTGSRLVTQNLDVLATITEDTCGRHDTIGGACAQESNVVRYGGTRAAPARLPGHLHGPGAEAGHGRSAT